MFSHIRRASAPNATRLRLLEECGGIASLVRRRALDRVANKSNMLPLERATLLDLAGRHADAEEVLRVFADGGGGGNDHEIAFAREVARRHAEFARQRENLGALRATNSTADRAAPLDDCPSSPSPVVPRLSSRAEAFAIRDRPFVLSVQEPIPWFGGSLELLGAFFDQAGPMKIPTRIRSSSSTGGVGGGEQEVPADVVWAHLRDRPRSGAQTYREWLRSEENDLIFDYSLWRTPLGRAFADAISLPLPHLDLLSAAQARAMPVSGSAFPTLFANKLPQPGAGPHIDFSHTHFYQLVCSGAKRYRFVCPGELCLLGPRYWDDLSSPWIPEGCLGFFDSKKVRVVMDGILGSNRPKLDNNK